ncbi:hypothetical protein DCG74_30635 [Bradyrhizobium sp. WBAH42]|nr:hypothetical protein [Bradyrhizobium sp. WBAH30]MDD1542139.1 hypothetical protein [Bradyrhizobium sp. WBAH41]MDD1556291.1 hypothetical protein [Bradyrhizobium sp. WBAH23]MDD1561868.1 hypothetical protein [Bradyrhizobium sp. WBAH33]MDD1589111.1 hypothetical protein [Bradyrhizobium sp. WBAH42]NRB87608.1 hypothetical protein [Bradyrhizobium sp. WBAH10]QCJ92435.1 hypothetical protein DAA57_31065 [Bradyrhizobium yuanmingense]
MSGIGLGANRGGSQLPPPLAGEGWGEGVSASESPQEERALTRRYAPTSPASGRGENKINSPERPARRR